MTENILTAFPGVKILKKVSLVPFTNTKTGGFADFLAFPESYKSVQSLLQFANIHELPVTVIGNASNLIIRDGGIRGLTIILTHMNQISIYDDTIVADAGSSLIEMTKQAQQASLSGLEFASGIPGSVGGAIFMNAGAYGGEISMVTESVVVLTANATLKTIEKSNLDFGYRQSRVQEEGDIVLAATFKLRYSDSHMIQIKMNDLNARRVAKQPLELPSCGSVFKRPEGCFAGKLIHDAGLQGFQSGGAQVSTKHAGFVVNLGQATATDYLNVIHHVQEVVLNKFNVMLETEVRIIGDTIPTY